VKFGQQLKERHQFSKFKMAAGRSRHVGFWQPAVFHAMDGFLFKVVTFLSNLMKFGQKNEGTASVFLNSRWR